MSITGINIALFPQVTSFSSFCEIFKEYPTTKIEFPIQLWLKLKEKKSVLKNLEVVGVSGILHKTELFPLSIFTDEKTFESQLLILDKKIHHINELNCSNVSVGIDAWCIYEKNYANGIFINRVRIIADYLKKTSVNLNLEYISPQVARNNGDNSLFLFCSSLKESLKIIEMVDRSNVFLLLDFLHWFCDNSGITIKNIKDYIGFVHLCDHTENKASKIKDIGRVLPYEGILPVDLFIQELSLISYNKPMTIEVFANAAYQPSNAQIKNSLTKIGENFGT